MHFNSKYDHIVNICKQQEDFFEKYSQSYFKINKITNELHIDRKIIFMQQFSLTVVLIDL